MKNFVKFIAFVLAVAPFSPVSQAEEKREDKPRFKGVELYSWKDGTGAWNYALLSGTNREKQPEVVKGTKNPIKSVEDLKTALGRLAVGEQVAWSHHIPGFEFPPASTRTEIKKAAKAADIVLRIAIDRE